MPGEYCQKIAAAHNSSATSRVHRCRASIAPLVAMYQKAAAWLNAGGIVAPLLWASTVIYSGERHPEYSHVRQYISDLAARGSSTQHVMQAAGFILPGLMTAGFGILLGRTGGRLAGIASALLIVSGLARAAAGVFVPDPLDHRLPPSFDERMHDAAGLLYILTLILAVVTWMIASATRPRPSIGFAAYSVVTVVAAIAAPPALIAAGIATAADVGLFQRAMLGVLNAWILALACVTFVERRYRSAVLASTSNCRGTLEEVP